MALFACGEMQKRLRIVRLAVMYGYVILELRVLRVGQRFLMQYFTPARVDGMHYFAELL